MLLDFGAEMKSSEICTCCSTQNHVKLLEAMSFSLFGGLVLFIMVVCSVLIYHILIISLHYGLLELLLFGMCELENEWSKHVVFKVYQYFLRVGGASSVWQ